VLLGEEEEDDDGRDQMCTDVSVPDVNKILFSDDEDADDDNAAVDDPPPVELLVVNLAMRLACVVLTYKHEYNVDDGGWEQCINSLVVCWWRSSPSTAAVVVLLFKLSNGECITVMPSAYLATILGVMLFRDIGGPVMYNSVNGDTCFAFMNGAFDDFDFPPPSLFFFFFVVPTFLLPPPSQLLMQLLLKSLDSL
jgi:hypothetical protein